MKVVCAKCFREGIFEKPAEAPPACQRHQVSLRSAAAVQPFEGIRLLLVVSAGEDVLFDYLRRAYAGTSDMAIIMERRHGERRLAEVTVPTDRRLQDRRQQISDVEAPWYRYLRFGIGWIEERSRSSADVVGLS
jgi:hypothetical protein